MEALIYDMVELLKKHYQMHTLHRQKSKALEEQLRDLSKLISRDLLAETEEVQENYLFFHDLTMDAQQEFLERHKLEYEDINSESAIATYTLIKEH